METTKCRIEFLGEIYIVDDGFGMSEEVLEIYVLDAINKSDTIEELVECLEVEYNFSIFPLSYYKEISDKKAKLNVYMEDLDKTYTQTINKSEVISFLNNFKLKNGYDFMEIEVNNDIVFAIMSN